MLAMAVAGLIVAAARGVQGDRLCHRGGFDVAARFRQTGWRRPAAEFVDPEIVILRRRQVPSS